MQDVFRDRSTGVAVNAWQLPPLYAGSYGKQTMSWPRWIGEAFLRPPHAHGAIATHESGKALAVNCHGFMVPCGPLQYIVLYDGELGVWDTDEFQATFEPIAAQETIRDQVAAFHRKFGVPVRETPGPISADRIRLRLRLIAEEFLEVLEASGASPQYVGEAAELISYALYSGTQRLDIVDLADGLADLDYVVEGARQEFGINGQPIAAEVHRTNMAKEGGATRGDGKILKPEWWQPPDIAGELLKQGWEG